MVFPGVMYRCESWTIKKAEHQRTEAFELWCWRRLLRVPWTAVHPKRNQSWIFIGRSDAEAETPIFWPPDTKNLLIRKDHDAGKHWRWDEKGTTEDETVGWLHCQRIDAFELWCWRRLLRVPWSAWRSNQSVLKKSTLNMHWKDWCWSWSSNTLYCLSHQGSPKDPNAGKDYRQKGKAAAENEMVR